MTFQTRRVAAACACGERFRDLTASANAGEYTCACGRSTPVSPVLSAVRGRYPPARFVIERFTSQPSAQTRVLACDGCGAKLEPADPEELVRCTYCSAVNTITVDAQIHRPFILLVDLDDPSLAGVQCNGSPVLR